MDTCTALTVPPTKTVQEHSSSFTLDSDTTSTVTRPTAFKRNHGTTIGGVKMIYDPTLYLAFDLKRDPRENDPAFIAWMTGQADTYVTTLTPLEPKAMRRKTSLNEEGGQQDDSQKSSTVGTKRCGLDKGLPFNAATIEAEPSSKQTASTIPRNRFGQRVDSPIEFNKEVRAKMQKERWCSNYHLKGNCHIIDCRFRHGVLDDEGKTALLSLTRGNVCRNGNACKEIDCYAGHQCPYDPCSKDESCHFPREMHVTDKEIVNIEVPRSPASHRGRSGEKSRHREGKG